MSDSFLVRYHEPLAGDVGTEFFRKAYQQVCEEQPDRRVSDRPALQGCLVQISQEYKLDITTQVGQQACVRLLGAFLSLGLEEASEGIARMALTILEAQPIEIILQLGMTLHAELRERSTAVLKKSVLKAESGLYGIIQPEHESKIREYVRQESVFSERAVYHEARVLVTRAEHFLVLSRHLPLAMMIDYGGSSIDFHREAYRRPNAQTASSMGGLLILFVRSYLIKALTTTHYTLPKLADDTSTLINSVSRSQQYRFVHDNFIAFTSSVRTLVMDLFYEPAKLHAGVAQAIEAVQRLFATTLVLRSSEGGRDVRFPTPPKNGATRQQVQELAVHAWHSFGQAAHAYFSQAADITMTPADLERFWYPQLIMRVREIYDPEEIAVEAEIGQRFLIKTGASIASELNLGTLIKIPADRIAEYTAQAQDWPADLRRDFIARYPWQTFADQPIGDEVMIAQLTSLVQSFGPEFLNKLSTKRFLLRFWMRAWNYAPKLRDAILAYFSAEKYPHAITGRGLLEAVKLAYGVGDDARLFILLLGRVMRDVPDEYIKGIALETLSGAIFSLIRCPSALKALFARLTPRDRERALARMGVDDAHQVRSLAGLK